MVQLGKRYRCEVCGTELLCTKAADGDPVCCQKEMELQQPNKEKSSDQFQNKETIISLCALSVCGEKQILTVVNHV